MQFCIRNQSKVHFSARVVGAASWILLSRPSCFSAPSLPLLLADFNINRLRVKVDVIKGSCAN